MTRKKFKTGIFLVNNCIILDKWCKDKDKKKKVQKKQKKKKQMVEKIKEIRRKQSASKGYKEWLKASIVKSKQENYIK